MNQRRELRELPREARLLKAKVGTLGAYVRDGEILTIHELAARFGRKDRWVRGALIPQGIPYRAFGSVVLFSGHEVRLWLESIPRPQFGALDTEDRDHA